MSSSYTFIKRPKKTSPFLVYQDFSYKITTKSCDTRYYTCVIDGCKGRVKIDLNEKLHVLAPHSHKMSLEENEHKESRKRPPEIPTESLKTLCDEEGSKDNLTSQLAIQENSGGFSTSEPPDHSVHRMTSQTADQSINQSDTSAAPDELPDETARLLRPEVIIKEEPCDDFTDEQWLTRTIPQATMIKEEYRQTPYVEPEDQAVKEIFVGSGSGLVVKEECRDISEEISEDDYEADANSSAGEHEELSDDESETNCSSGSSQSNMAEQENSIQSESSTKEGPHFGQCILTKIVASSAEGEALHEEKQFGKCILKKIENASTDTVMYQCLLCLKTYTQFLVFKYHVIAEHPLCCQGCWTLLASKAGLQDHKTKCTRENTEDPDEPCVPPGNMKLFCVPPGTRILRRAVKGYHRRPFQCLVCKTKYESMEAFKEHASGVHPRVCPFCWRMTKAKGKKDEVVRPCDFCEKRYHRKGIQTGARKSGKTNGNPQAMIVHTYKKGVPELLAEENIQVAKKAGGVPSQSRKNAQGLLLVDKTSDDPLKKPKTKNKGGRRPKHNCYTEEDIFADELEQLEDDELESLEDDAPAKTKPLTTKDPLEVNKFVGECILKQTSSSDSTRTYHCRICEKLFQELHVFKYHVIGLHLRVCKVCWIMFETVAVRKQHEEECTRFQIEEIGHVIKHDALVKYKVIHTSGRELLTSGSNVPQNQFNLDGTVTDTRKLDAFIKDFKTRRMKLGLSQTDVAKALPVLNIPGVKAQSQGTISKFERRTLALKTMHALLPILSDWLSKAESNPNPTPPDTGGPEAPEEKPRRSVLSDSDRQTLEDYFEVQPMPSVGTVGAIAKNLGLEEHLVRAWFCQQREKQPAASQKPKEPSQEPTRAEPRRPEKRAKVVEKKSAPGLKQVRVWYCTKRKAWVKQDDVTSGGGAK